MELIDPYQDEAWTRILSYVLFDNPDVLDNKQELVEEINDFKRKWEYSQKNSIKKYETEAWGEIVEIADKLNIEPHDLRDILVN